MTTCSSSALYQQYRQQLAPLYPPAEATAIATAYLEETLSLTRAQLLTDRPVEIDDVTTARMEDDLNRLRNGEPLQYVLGHTTFCDLTLNVTPAVLIPRPETQELVLLAKELLPQTECRLLDVGTGSGCIAIALALSHPQAMVEAWDISERALSVARDNANLHKVTVQWAQQDVLEVLRKDQDPQLRASHDSYDLIVSNPPYIPAGESSSLHDNIVRYEPHTALFVPDSDPLIFYRALANLAHLFLSPQGHLLVETHSSFTHETAELFQRMGLEQIEIREDSFGKPRLIKAQCR